MDIVCSKDPTHQSTDSDYCSICGAKIAGVPSGLPLASPPDTALLAALASPSVTGEACPDCGATRISGAKFCEVCRFDFVTSVSGISAPAPTLAPPPEPLHWQVSVAVDPALYLDPDPLLPCPVGEPERLFPLQLAEVLVGRHSEKRDIHPEIALTDPGVSHRHAKLARQDDGTWELLDLGSANGTMLNGAEVAAGTHTPLQDGDQITLGCWTRITVRTQV